MTDEVKNFRVAVLTTLEVEAVDWIDAVNVAEGALKHAIKQADSSNSRLSPVMIEWMGRNRNEYRAFVVNAPTEVSIAMCNGYINVVVSQPEED